MGLDRPWQDPAKGECGGGRGEEWGAPQAGARGEGEREPHQSQVGSATPAHGFSETQAPSLFRQGQPSSIQGDKAPAEALPDQRRPYQLLLPGVLGNVNAPDAPDTG